MCGYLWDAKMRTRPREQGNQRTGQAAYHAAHVSDGGDIPAAYVAVEAPRAVKLRVIREQGVAVCSVRYGR
jgi:hypothetical protein